MHFNIKSIRHFIILKKWSEFWRNNICLFTITYWRWTSIFSCANFSQSNFKLQIILSISIENNFFNYLWHCCCNKLNSFLIRSQYSIILKSTCESPEIDIITIWEYFFHTCGPLRPEYIFPVIFSWPPVLDKAEPVPLLSFFFFLLLWEFNKWSSCCLGEWCRLLLVSLRFVCEWILTNLTIQLRTMAMLNKHLKEI
jgi:hypothetical protein